MALTRAEKEGLLARYQEGMAAAPHAFLMHFEGVSVPQVTELRAKIAESGGDYIVVKNRLAKRAIEGVALEQHEELFSGPTAVAFSGDDPVALAKVLTEFAEDLPKLEFKGGVVDGQTVSAEQISEIATLPSRDELIAKLVFLLQSPVTRFVRTLHAIPRDFVAVLGQVAQKKG